MTKFKTNLRKVATIVACLAVTAVFAACEQTNPKDDENTPTGKIDSKLVGVWERHDQYNIGGTLRSDYAFYNFYKNGSFQYNGSSTAIADLLFNATGKYTVADGKITFTDISYKRGENATVKFNQKVFEYLIQNKEGTAVLLIGRLHNYIEEQDYIGTENGSYFTQKKN
jgi:hypothetical protein